LRNYQFLVAIGDVTAGADTPYVAGVRSVSGLRAQITATETWEGGNNRHRYANPNRVTWEPITLEQGLALDRTLEDWSEVVLDFCLTGKPPKTNEKGTVKRQVIIDVWDENEFPAGPPDKAPPLALEPNPTPSPRSERDGTRCRRYKIHNAWISKYQAIPKLDSMTSEVALLSIELMHEGWVREDIK
jgi:phage tail-like protein